MPPTPDATARGGTRGGLSDIVIEQSKRAHVGHIGSSLHPEPLAVLYGGALRLDGDDRDRFVLSKGHVGRAVFRAAPHRGAGARNVLL